MQVFSNLGNYRTFGFTKIIPRVSASKFEAVVEQSVNANAASALWADVITLSYERWGCVLTLV